MRLAIRVSVDPVSVCDDGHYLLHSCRRESQFSGRLAAARLHVAGEPVEEGVAPCGEIEAALGNGGRL